MKLSKESCSRLYQAWHESAVDNIPPYASWQLRVEGCTITCYQSGKVVFQGRDAEVYAAPFLHKDIILPQAGSDEVGTGDYFGPVCVCACIVEEKDLDALKKLGVRDSKQLTDDEIRVIAPQLMKRLRYSLLIVTDEKYNQVHDTSNMNAIKSKLHNQAYINLSRKTALPDLKIIDQFTPAASYYRYLEGEKAIVRGIHFETKAEDKYPAVGSASMIARYAFLKCMDDMEAKYDMHFQKGASAKTDEDARLFIQKYGIGRLNEVAKLHFKNTERATDQK